MSSTYYTSLSGMMAASYGLQNTSNNIANMHTAGYKRNDVFYSSLGNGNGQNGLGSGVYVGGQSTNFSTGSYLDSASPSDLAIIGNGFFVVKMKNGEYLYTRSGEFGFNDDGWMIDRHSGGLVQGYNKQGELAPISQSGPKISAGKASGLIELKGEFILKELDASQQHDKDKYMPVSFDVTVYDESGKAKTITLEFKAEDLDLGAGIPPPNQKGLRWVLKSASCKEGSPVNFSEESIKFESYTNSTSVYESAVTITLNGTQKIKLKFSDKGDDASSSVRLYEYSQIDHSSSKIEVKKQDGYAVGRQIGASFDDNGLISYSYDNGQSIEGLHVALAGFDDLAHTLVRTPDGLFRARHDHGQFISRPNKQGLGAIQTKKLEAANVDSTTEFANIVVLQRMFQACSQIMDIDKQLLEEIEKK
ncbi:flagellar hook-basal body complex protein [Legionella sp. CNM-4043-24]|uniref:flagellar hook-basal body complex protein n=1 Tax=Legionella sp. CNM-4043-24 TaxID=3421646 RepID=UPI00403AEA57